MLSHTYAIFKFYNFIQSFYAMLHSFHFGINHADFTMHSLKWIKKMEYASYFRCAPNICGSVKMRFHLQTIKMWMKCFFTGVLINKSRIVVFVKYFIIKSSVHILRIFKRQAWRSYDVRHFWISILMCLHEFYFNGLCMEQFCRFHSILNILLPLEKCCVVVTMWHILRHINDKNCASLSTLVLLFTIFFACVDVISIAEPHMINVDDFINAIIFNEKGTIHRCESWISLWFSGMPKPMRMKTKAKSRRISCEHNQNTHAKSMHIMSVGWFFVVCRISFCIHKFEWKKPMKWVRDICRHVRVFVWRKMFCAPMWCADAFPLLAANKIYK